MFDQEVSNYLKKCFRHNNYSMKRDIEAENFIFLMSLIELILLSTLESERISEWLPDGDKGHLPSGASYEVCTKGHGLGAVVVDDKILPRINSIDENSFLYQVPPRTSLINLFRIINDMQSIDTAVLALKALFVSDIEKNEIPSCLKMSLELYICNKASQHNLYSFIDQYGFYVQDVEIIIINGKKLVLPIVFFEHKKCDSKFKFYFPMPGRLYNIHLLQANREDIQKIFITCSIEIAKRNQMELYRQERKGFAWSSWHGKTDSIDWSIFKGRQVYYLLKKHSGKTKEDIYRTALEIYKKLSEAGVADIKFIYCLADFNPRDPYRFKIISSDQFLKYAPFQSEYLASCPVPFPDHFFIKPQTATLFYGPRHVGLTPYALITAFGIARGLQENSFHPQAKPSVLYIRAGNDLSFFINLKNTLKASFRKNEAWVNEHYKAPSSNYMIQKYPVQKNATRLPHEHQETNFYWATSWYDQVDVSKTDGQITVDSEMMALEIETGTPISLLVLDSLKSLNKLSNSSAAVNCFSAWLDRLKKRGCAVIIIPPGAVYTEKQSRMLKRLPLDNIIHFDKEASFDSSKIALSMYYERLSGSEEFLLPSVWEFSPKSEIPTIEQIEDNNIKHTHLMNEITKWVKRGLSYKEIAEKTGQTENNIKQLRKRAGLAKKQKKVSARYMQASLKKAAKRNRRILGVLNKFLEEFPEELFDGVLPHKYRDFEDQIITMHLSGKSSEEIRAYFVDKNKIKLPIKAISQLIELIDKISNKIHEEQDRKQGLDDKQLISPPKNDLPHEQGPS